MTRALERLTRGVFTDLPDTRQYAFLADPRPDLTDDSAMWDRLLNAAEDLDGDDPEGLCGALRGLRSLGAGLVRGEKGWRLEASRGYWSTPEEWKADADRWLKPHIVALRALLSTLPNHHQVAPATAAAEGEV